ncbi:hypothetical protein [Halomicrobium mukohataei]|nr:hypothetical protein [Halomicrobium mukohataei]
MSETDSSFKGRMQRGSDFWRRLFSAFGIRSPPRDEADDTTSE